MYPAMAPWTALWARRVQYTLSEALLGIARIIYVGSAMEEGLETNSKDMTLAIEQ